MTVEVRMLKSRCDYDRGRKVPLKTAKAAAIMIKSGEAELVNKEDQKLIDPFLAKKKVAKVTSKQITKEK